MKKYKLNIGIIMCFVAGLFAVMSPGCRDAGYSGELAAIDSLLQTDPDSAWRRLIEYDTALLRSDNDRHYYALLSAEANYKTFRDDTSDNAISDAAEYFVKRNDGRNAVRSMFYKGIGYYNSGKYGLAIITQLKSIEMSDTADHLYRGKIYNAISEAYKAVSDAPQELEYARLSLEEYQELDSLVFIEDLKLACGYALCRNNKVDEGIREMREVYAAAVSRNDKEMTEAALKYLALGYLWGSDDKRAKDCLAALYAQADDKSTLGEYLFLYLNSMIYTGVSSDSIEMIKNILVKELNVQENFYRYYAYKGDYKEAYRAATRALHQNDSLIEERVHSSVSHEVKKYMDEERTKASLKITRLNGIIIWVAVSLFLLICLILTLVRVYTVSKIKKEKDLLYSLEILTKEKTEIVSRIDKLSSENENLLKENDILKKEYVAYGNMVHNPEKETEKFESELLTKLFGELDALHSQYYLHGDSEKGKTVILNQLSEQLALLREDMEILQNIEGYINNTSDGVLDEVYEFASLNINQRRVVALLCIGFSKEAVCQIMGIEMQSFYMRMNRLTKRIEACDSPRRNDLLAMIGRGKG